MLRYVRPARSLREARIDSFDSLPLVLPVDALPKLCPIFLFDVNLGSPKSNGPKALRGHCLLGNRQICSHDRQSLIEYVHSALYGRVNVVIRHGTWWGHIG